MIREYIIRLDDTLKGFDDDVDELERRFDAEEITKGHWTLAGHLATSNNGLKLFGCVCSECERITFISSSMNAPKCCPFCETKMSE